jgi:signal transduction histidine kinase/CheY-like chemotaxis protein/HPt (histidine-containing phosphotransfer) domain-containing protein
VARRGRIASGSAARRAAPPGIAAIDLTIAYTADLGTRAAMATGSVTGIALLAVSCALLVVAVLTALRMRADARRETAARRARAGLARAYAELSAAKAAIEARSAQLEATLAGMSDGVMMLDGENRLVQWNDRFPELTGVPRGMLAVGVSMAEMVRAQAEAGEFPHGLPDREAKVARRMAAIGTTRQHAVIERERPDGRVIELRRNPLPNGGTVTLYTDITARRHADAAQREVAAAAAGLVEQRAQFIAMVCHEVTTPLDTVLECLRALEQPATRTVDAAPPPPEVRRAQAAADTMAELMHDILDMAQLDAGRLTLRPADYTLADLLARVAEDFARRAAERSMRVVVELAPDLPPRLHGDGGRIRQVLANFISNAVKYASPGEIMLRASRLDLGAPMLRLAVADRGPPVPPAQAVLLFQPFTRLAGAATEDAAAPPGAGLGLVICERLARAMGGAVGLSASAGGNEFWLTVPLQPASTPPPAAQAGPSALAPARRHRRASVLLVEDLLVNQLVVATRLRRDGHHVDLAASGAEALGRIAEAPYDVVLTDLMMPGMSGFEVAQAIRALPGPAGRLPIYALTATTSDEDRERCRAAGMQGMLAKPVEAAALAAALAADPMPPAAPLPTLPPAAQSPSALLVDAPRLAALRAGLPPGLFAELATQCVGDLHEQMAALRTALRGDAAEPIEASAHAMAGMAGNYGLPAIDARMRRIMAAARAGDLAGARAAAQGSESELERTAQALDLLLQLHDA